MSPIRKNRDWSACFLLFRNTVFLRKMNTLPVSIVDAGHRAVIFDRFRGVQDTVAGEGTHFVIPWVQKPIIFDCRSRPRNVPVITGSKGELDTFDVMLQSIVTLRQQACILLCWFTHGNSIVFPHHRSAERQYHTAHPLPASDQPAATHLHQYRWGLRWEGSAFHHHRSFEVGGGKCCFTHACFFNIVIVVSLGPTCSLCDCFIFVFLFCLYYRLASMPVSSSPRENLCLGRSVRTLQREPPPLASSWTTFRWYEACCTTCRPCPCFIFCACWTLEH